ncbi:cytidine deaminase-like fold-containing protein [Stieleria varia]|uniref:cytidine deaminase-like fold-containing protein n=1 Tax=Stieleria varia TaxID=2528005 RepID=UPI003CC7A06E
MGIPAATTDDAFTLSRLDIDGHSFFGINGGVANSDDAARTLQKLAAELGHKGPTFQLLRHAEGDVLLQGFNRGNGQGKSATLYVDNLFVCQGCKSGLNNMRRLLGLEKLTVIDRAGNVLVWPR